MRRILPLFLFLLPALSPLASAQVGADPGTAAETAAGAVTDADAAAEGADAKDDAVKEGGPSGIEKGIDEVFGQLVNALGGVIFYNLGSDEPITDDAGVKLVGPRGDVKIELPVMVLWLVIGAIFFTFFLKFVNFRMFGHAIQVTRGKYDDPNDQGEVTHFQALTSALSATVGLGNIAGVAAAIALGGPGAVFWMWFIAFFGMCMKFSSCTFAQIYRRNEDSETERTLGGPMVYLEEGLKDVLGSTVAKLFGVVYAVLCIGASFGGGNLFQGNQTAAALIHTFGFEQSDVASGVVGLSLAILAGVVIVGGIRRIGEVTSKIVPAMCVFYVGVCLFTILSNLDKAGPLFTSIFSEAFSGAALDRSQIFHRGWGRTCSIGN